MKVNLVVLAATLLSAPALAQDGPQTAVDGHALLRALELPVRAQEVRQLGAPEEEVRKILERTREGGMSASESADLLEVEAGAVREHGQVDNFGAFVGERLEEGLRGQDLAAAIRAEHEARGKGKPAHAGEGKHEGAHHAGEHQGEGKQEHAQEGEHHGEAKAKAKADEAGAHQGGPGRAGGPSDSSRGKATKQRPAGK